MTPDDEGKPYYRLLFAWQLVMNGLAARMGAPVYLVGSALTKAEPHDYDLRCVLSEHDLWRLFGPRTDSTPAAEGLDGPREWRRRYEQLKQSRRLSLKLQRNIDFQIQDEAEAMRYIHKQHVRVDWAPEGFFDAGLEDA